MAGADAIRTPGYAADIEGNSNNTTPFDVWEPTRMQQVYASSEFASWSGPQYIQSIVFRGDRTTNQFGATIADIKIELSTTQRGPDGLNPVFANNTGADAQVVYEGPLSIFSTATPTDGTQARPFDIVVNLQHPFSYDPSKGNLLLDITNPLSSPSKFMTSGRPLVDALEVTGDAVSRVLGYNRGGHDPVNPYDVPDLTRGHPDTIGLATEFRTGGPDPLPQPGLPEVVPEPAATTVVAFALALLVLTVRRRHRAF